MDEPQKHYAKWNKQAQMVHIVWFNLYEISRKGKDIETESILVVSRDQEWRQQRLQMDTRDLLDVMEMF